MTDRTWIPVERWIASWPAGQFDAPSLDDVAIVDFEMGRGAEAITVDLTLALGADLSLTLPGVEGVELRLLSDGVATRLGAQAVLGTSFALHLREVRASLLFPGGLLRPMARSDEDAPWEPVVLGDGSYATLAATFEVALATVDGDGRVVLDPPPALTLSAFALGETGFVLEPQGLTLVLSDAAPPPEGQRVGFRGVVIDRLAVHLPPAFALDVAPDEIVATGLVIGSGGASGTLTGAWTPEWSGSTVSGSGAGSLAGFAFGLESLSIGFARNAVTSAALAGRIALPFFDQPVGVSVSVASDGALALAVSGDDLVTIDLPGIGSLEISSLGFVSDDEGDALLVSGSLTLEVGSPALTWPTIEVQDLRIGADGGIRIPSGWIDLQQPIALDLYGFGLEITRVGFGNEDDGRRWIGVDGAVRLTELLPAGASARGLRVLWDPQRPSDVSLSLDGIGVSFGVPDAFEFQGMVAMEDDPKIEGLKVFRGSLGLGLDALDVGVDADIVIGRDPPDTYVYVHLGVNVPIPLAATGAALYGMEALFAMNMEPDAVGGDWYGWYRKPTAFDATDALKWKPKKGSWAFGAGLSLGTLPDAGFSVNTKGLLVFLLPGPVILLEGKADIFKVPAALGDADQEGTLSLLAALDGRAGTLQLGIDAAWSLARILEIGASTEAFFDFDRLDAWHLWIGQDTPESARIRADYLSLFHADAWLMLDAHGVSTGLGVSWGDSWRFGPVRVTLAAWVGSQASLSYRPAQLAGALDLGGEASIAAGPFGIGINVEATLSGKSFAPYEVKGTLSVVVELPFPLKDLDVDIGLEWSTPATPVVDDPFESALVEHDLCTESWAPSIDEVASSAALPAPEPSAPVVPLDAHVLLTFAKPMGDEPEVADNAPAATPAIRIGDHEARYSLADLRLHRQSRTHPEDGWQDVTDSVVASWTPDAGGAGSRLQLFARSPFAFTRFTSRRWIDSFLEGAGEWPCSPAPAAEPVCVDWLDQPQDTKMPALWVEKGATFATGAELTVVSFPNFGPVLRLGASHYFSKLRPGVLWVSLPEPAAEVSALVNVPRGNWVVLRAWSNGQPVGQDTRVLGSGVLRVAAADIDALTLDWGYTVEADLGRICWMPQRESDALEAWSRAQDRLREASERWESDEPVLDPESYYLLELTTRAVLEKGGAEVSRVEQVRHLQFQTGGPPGIAPAWVTALPDAFPAGGVLEDLAPYVRWTIPGAAARPVFRAYDLGCEFEATHVQQMYGADMRIRLRDDDGQPVKDAGGTEVLLGNAWEEAPTATLSTSDAAWLSRLDSCTGAVKWTGLRGDDQLLAGLPAGVVLDPERAYTAELVASRPLFTDPFDDLGAFDTLALATGDAVTSCSATGGTATIARPASAVTVAALARGVLADAVVEANAHPHGDGAFGLVARHSGPGAYVSLELTPGVGRRLLEHAGGDGPLHLLRVLWEDDAPVSAGQDYALGLRCEGTRVTATIDGEEHAATTTLGAGRVGLLSGIRLSAGGCAFTDLVVRSAPRTAVHAWRFTTSRYRGLPELGGTFVGRVWPIEDATPAASLGATAAEVASRSATAQASMDAARAALAAADPVDLPALGDAARTAVDEWLAATADGYEQLAAALGLPWRPAPPVVEVCTLVVDGGVVALALDLPEPLPRERMACALRHGGGAPLAGLAIAWSEDGTRVLLVREDGSAFASGRWTLELTLHLDVGGERAVWRRGGGTSPEVASLAFTL